MHVAIDHAFILLFKVGEVADVYQVVNEDEYSDIVCKRQEEEVWVIDDGEKFIAFVLKLHQRQALTAKVHTYHFTSATA